MSPGGSSVPADWLVADWHAYRFGLVARGLMTTRHGGCSWPPFDSMNLHAGGDDAADALARNRVLFTKAIGVQPVFLHQVHGVRVVEVGAADTLAGASRHTADAAFTVEPGVACAVQVADCLPILFAAPGGRAVGAAHAGWRGLAGGVVEATIDAVCTAAACAPADLDAWLGACIGPRNFEVGADVLEAFGVAPDSGAAARTGATRSRFQATRSGKWLADLPGLARDRLAAAGVARVSGGAWCTVADASRFFSYRRDGVTGRMVAAVWIDRAGGGAVVG